MKRKRHVAVLIATYNGEAYLREQVESLENQTEAHIDLWFSDDGSTDGTLHIIEACTKSWKKGRAQCLEGPRKGVSQNFGSLISNSAIQADYFSFCDQDDVWDIDKLETALDWLSEQPADQPALFCSRTRIIDAEGRFAGLSPLFRKAPNFRNALVQNIGGGNTMVMNRAAREIVKQGYQSVDPLIHDWWCYIMISGAGGVVHYSDEPKIGYRQHSKNLIGANNSWRARIGRMRMMLRGRSADWNDRNIAGLLICQAMLTQEARETLQTFSQARSGTIVHRIMGLIRSRVYRQTALGHLGLYIASALRKL